MNEDIKTDEFKKDKARNAIEAGRYDIAISEMQNLLKFSPQDSQAWYIIFNALAEQGKFQEALPAIENALKYEQRNADYFKYYAQILWNLDRHDEAVNAFENALRLEPYNYKIMCTYAEFLQTAKTDYVRAEELILRAIDLEPAFADNHKVYADICTNLGDYEEAEKGYLKALELDPNDPYIYNDYGSFYLNQKNDPDKAHELYRTALKINPSMSIARENFILTLKAKNKFYKMFWNYSLIVNKYRIGWMLPIGVGLLIKISKPIAKHNPALLPYILVIVWACVLFSIYIWLINPLFDFMIKRDWIK
jgi:tetratricopeptide (TPR) repeat protein